MHVTRNASAGLQKNVVDLSGLHIVANILVPDPRRLCDSASFKDFINEKIDQLGLRKVGEIYHDFENGGYTAVVCLTESHLSIHTWPESSYLTFDVFLSNYLKDNTAVTNLIYDSVRKFFNGEVVFEQRISR